MVEIKIKSYNELIEFIKNTNHSIELYKKIIRAYATPIEWEKAEPTKQQLIEALKDYAPYFRQGVTVPIHGEQVPDIGNRKTNPKNK